MARDRSRGEGRALRRCDARSRPSAQAGRSVFHRRHGDGGGARAPPGAPDVVGEYEKRDAQHRGYRGDCAGGSEVAMAKKNNKATRATGNKTQPAAAKNKFVYLFG